MHILLPELLAIGDGHVFFFNWDADDTTSQDLPFVVDGKTDGDGRWFLRGVATKTHLERSLINPDGVAAIQDPTRMIHIPAEVYPNGFEIEHIIVTTEPSCDDTIVLEEWQISAGSWSEVSDIDSITLSGIRTEVTRAEITDSFIAADNYIAINWPAAPDDLNLLILTIIGAPRHDS